MYAHLTSFQVPADKMSILRELINTEYLRIARGQPGFIRAYLLEQADDPNRAKLIQVWENQHALETFRKTGAIDMANRQLHLGVPGLIMQSEGYIVRARPE